MPEGDSVDQWWKGVMGANKNLNCYMHMTLIGVHLTMYPN